MGGIGRGWQVDIARICERDGWTCHICQGLIRRELKFPHPLSRSVDHVLPLALGGRHEDGNLKAAHLRCNCRKGSMIARQSARIAQEVAGAR